MEDEPFDFSTPITEDTVLLAKWDCPVEGHTIQDLINALKAGDAETKFPVNTQIDDYTNGSYDPWLVGHYGAQYGNSDVTGAYLYRKYVHPVDMAWGSGDNYGESAINTYLNGDYFNSCSDDIKNAVAQIDLPLVNGTTPAKMFLMSGAEVMGMSTGYAGGVAWDGWKERTGLTTPSTQPNAGRVMAKGEIANGSGDAWRLRTEMENDSGEASVTFDGAIRAITSGVEAGLVIACFVPIPEPPSLAGLKAALNRGVAANTYPVGTEIEDEYDGQSNPLIVAQYLDESNNSAYYNSNGVILVRKYVEPVSQTFGSNVNYITSTIIGFLDTTYYNNCSEELKSTISNFGVPYYTGTQMEKVTGKWFLMSAYEVCSKGSGTYEGVMWDYWKEKTHLSAPDNLLSSNSGRIMKGRDGTNQHVWLRSRYDSSLVCYVYTTGDVTYNGPSNSYGVIPACFIEKNAEPTPEALTAQEYDNLQLSAQAYDNANLTAEQYDTNGKNLLT